MHCLLLAALLSLPTVHLSKTDWAIERGAPCLSEHTEEVLTGLLGMRSDEVAALRAEGVL